MSHAEPDATEADAEDLRREFQQYLDDPRVRVATERGVRHICAEARASGMGPIATLIASIFVAKAVAAMMGLDNNEVAGLADLLPGVDVRPVEPG